VKNRILQFLEDQTLSFGRVDWQKYEWVSGVHDWGSPAIFTLIYGKNTRNYQGSMESIMLLETFKSDPHQGSLGFSYYNDGKANG
jgi:hypothetical protein